MYLDEEPSFGPVTGFGRDSRFLEWIQPPAWYLVAVVFHEGVLQVGGETIPFDAGSVLLIEPSSRCRIERTAENEDITHFWVNFLPSSTGMHLVALPRVSNLGEDLDFWNKTFRDALDVMPFTKRHLHVAAWSLLWSISQNAANLRRNPYVAAAERFVGQNLGAALNVGSVAQAIQISHNHLIRLFREELGLTPSEYIRSQRVRQACQLLLSTSDPIKEIGQRVGYPDPKHFHRVMVASVGCGPAELRRDRRTLRAHAEGKESSRG